MATAHGEALGENANKDSGSGIASWTLTVIEDDEMATNVHQGLVMGFLSSDGETEHKTIQAFIKRLFSELWTISDAIC